MISLRAVVNAFAPHMVVVSAQQRSESLLVGSIFLSITIKMFQLSPSSVESHKIWSNQRSDR